MHIKGDFVASEPPGGTSLKLRLPLQTAFAGARGRITRPYEFTGC